MPVPIADHRPPGLAPESVRLYCCAAAGNELRAAIVTAAKIDLIMMFPPLCEPNLAHFNRGTDIQRIYRSFRANPPATKQAMAGLAQRLRRTGGRSRRKTPGCNAPVSAAFRPNNLPLLRSYPCGRVRTGAKLA